MNSSAPSFTFKLQGSGFAWSGRAGYSRNGICETVCRALGAIGGCGGLDRFPSVQRAGVGSASGRSFGGRTRVDKTSDPRTPLGLLVGSKSRVVSRVCRIRPDPLPDGVLMRTVPHALRVARAVRGPARSMGWRQPGRRLAAGRPPRRATPCCAGPFSRASPITVTELGGGAPKRCIRNSCKCEYRMWVQRA